MNATIGKQRLRTKTGCLTCRTRRKKCDEKTPICSLCRVSNRPCHWPTASDLVDRRYASHHLSRHVSKEERSSDSSNPSNDDLEPAELVVQRRWPHPLNIKISLPSEAMTHRGLSHDLEVAICQHFVEHYYGLLLLPDCHPAFYDGWITEIHDLTARNPSLHYSLLANSASHIHFLDGNNTMQELALTYYSNALVDLSKLLSSQGHLENHNGLLMSIMLLYLHGCMGRGTYTDIPRHLSAATRVLTLRLFSEQPAISRPFDRLAVESVLYQIFLVTTGLWSEDFPLNYNFDSEFWRKAEIMLDQNPPFPGQTNSVNSPVLGLPVSLFRLVLSLKQLLHNLTGSKEDILLLESLQSEVEDWEALVLCNKHVQALIPEDHSSTHLFYRDASYLYTLILSLLVEEIHSRLQQPRQAGLSKCPGPASPDSWQVVKAVQILSKHRDSDEWKLCFIGNWPTYTLGYLVPQEHIEVIKDDINGRWRLTRFAQLARFSTDLLKTWKKRGFVTEDTADSMLEAAALPS